MLAPVHDAGLARYALIAGELEAATRLSAREAQTATGHSAS